MDFLNKYLTTPDFMAFLEIMIVWMLFDIVKMLKYIIDLLDKK